MPAHADWSAPGFGPGRWLGRAPTLAALLRMLGGGATVSIFGGAKLGKTSLLRQTGLEIGPAAAFVSAAAHAAAPPFVRAVEKALDRAAEGAGAKGGGEPGRLNLLVDDADALLETPHRESLERLAGLLDDGRAGAPVSLALAGTRPWREASRAAGFALGRPGRPVRAFPLALWDRRQVGNHLRRLGPEAPAPLVRRLLEESGSHPFLLKGLTARWPDLDGAASAAKRDFEAAFRAWHAQMAPSAGDRGGVDARPLMSWLVERGEAATFTAARAALKRAALKEEADLLVGLGVVERRLKGDEAVAYLRAPCGLFNDWYRRAEWQAGGAGAAR